MSSSHHSSKQLLTFYAVRPESIFDGLQLLNKRRPTLVEKPLRIEYREMSCDISDTFNKITTAAYGMEWVGTGHYFGLMDIATMAGSLILEALVDYNGFSEYR